jgi:phosphoribosylanthranilate isomerase
VPVEIKFCGLTRPDDARAAASLGAGYVGVIFAGGPRQLRPLRARDVLERAGPAVKRVGVFGTQTVAEIARVAREAGLQVVQLHGDTNADEIRRVRDAAQVAVWAVVRVRGKVDPSSVASLDVTADAIVFDAFAADQLGGTGTTFDWTALVDEARPRRAKVVLAGGLTPSNVGAAIAALNPDIVDVSSGVESSPGIKDHDRMRAFADAVRRTRNGE